METAEEKYKSRQKALELSKIAKEQNKPVIFLKQGVMSSYKSPHRINQKRKQTS